jgi:hypothetical protein
MNRSRNLRRILLAAALAVAAACSTKSPTAPSSPSLPSNPQPPLSIPTYTLTVIGKPSTITAGSGQSSTITVSAASTSNGAPPPALTPVTLTTTLGTFGNGQSSVSLQLVNGTTTATLTPGTIAGTATLAATIAPVCTSSTAGTPCPQGACNAFQGVPACQGSGGGAVNILGTGTFFLNAVSPNTGDPAGGATVTITGGGFIAPVQVQFAGSSAAVQKVSPNSLVVTVPPSAQAVPVGTTLPVSITVQNDVGGTAGGSATLSNAFIYVPGGGSIQQPQVFSITPASGTNDGGTQVTLTGQGFVSPVQVFFGTGTSASSFTGVEATLQSVTSTKIVAITPPARGFGQDNTNLVVSVLVKNLASGFATVDPLAFQYGSKVLITSVGPTTTPYNSQVKVTIFGQGFASPVAVSLAGIAATVLSTSGTEIDVLSGIPTISGCANVASAVSVTNINNGDSATGPVFTYLVPKPFVTAVQVKTPATSNPATIVQGGGPVTLTGGNFIPGNDQVQIGTGSATVTGGTSTTLQINAPPFSGTFPTTSCTGAGGVTGTMNLPAPENLVITDAVTSCTTTLNGALIYEPANNGCTVTTTAPVASFSDVVETGGNTVIFSDNSTGNPTTWAWNFGDGTTSAAPSPPPHTYTMNGTYAVTLTVSNSAGSSSFGAFVTVPGT